MTELNFKEEWLPVEDLLVDPEIQRSYLDLRKIERIVLRYNPAALGVIHVSRRNAASDFVIDGWHRLEATRRVTTNTGKLLAHVYEGLTKAEEAQMFLDLNAGNQPNIIDKFRARNIAGDPDAIAIKIIVGSHGWRVEPGQRKGSIQCVGTLEKIYKAGQRAEFEPEILDMTVRIVTKAWDLDPKGVMAAVLEGTAAVVMEYGDQLDVDRVINRISNYPGGAEGLLENAKSFARSRRGRTTMGVAELIVEEYNKGLKTRGLYPWRKRK